MQLEWWIVIIGTVVLGVTFFIMWGEDFVPTLFVAGIVSIIIAMTVGGVISQVTQKPTVVRDWDLLALSNGSQVEGHFFLGSGTINERSVYTYLRQTSDGGAYLGSVPANQSLVYETDGNPRIEVIEDCSDINSWFSCADNEIFPRYRIYIPDGSIWYGYDVDVRND